MMVMLYVPEIRRITNHHDNNNIRKWIHRFNKQGIGVALLYLENIYT